MKILLVEDDLEISKLLAEFLQENGYEVFCQYDGLHVLDCLRENNIDLILLDIMLPYRNGDTVLTAVRECSTVPIIIISAKGTTQNKIDLLRLGADDYITKPFDMIRLALDKCTDSKLYVAMNLSFACSLRMGEILGLTWENVHISDEDIAADNAYVYIDKELTRASKRAIETLGEKDIYYIFTPLMPNTSTRIILKKPKTDSSIRKVWLPKTLAYILREWKKSQDELKGFLGDEYQDFNLVVALPNGRPCEDRIILKEFAKLREDAGLPKVVFHSLRHSSTTYKLKLNHGDLKATQGDTGHAEIDMITSIYAHILDEDRKVNAQKFETAFYAKPDLRNVRPPEEPAKSEPATLDLESLVEQLQKSPELASALAALIAAQAPAK